MSRVAVEPPTSDPHRAVAVAFREQSGKVVATLARAFRSIDLAEDAVQEAFETALRVWPERGMPEKPAAWITTTARNKALDRVRREARRPDLEASAQGTALVTDDDPALDEEIPDDRLRLVFTCCHPALNAEARVALTLRLLGGLSTSEIARAFLVTEATMAKRLVRAKRKIAAAGIPYRVPDSDELPNRLHGVLATLYLAFTAGHVATTGDDLLRLDICEEAIRLTRVLWRLMPDEPEVSGLLALMLLTHSRRDARVGDDGSLVLLEDQPRRLWDHTMKLEGLEVLDSALRGGTPGQYQTQAAIAAVHAEAAQADDTDWDQIVGLYDALLDMRPGPVVALNRAVAVAKRDGPDAGLVEANEVLAGGRLEGYPYLHATRGDLLARLGRIAEAAAAFRRALELTVNPAEKRYLESRIEGLGR
ncbi:MAG TPA: RNA polymerase sigma factor [Acidimicrobiia bacterium]|jgi:RNA polymerase sigma-70 factor (ECF subfamily)|nr:RNA polymerase sigma factor [Acidimicrobiia bacterium]